MEAFYGSLRISSIPDSAKVFLDGEEKGKTPIMFHNISVGRHFIKLSKENCREKRILLI